MKSTFEKMGGTYTLEADGIYYPNLVSTDEEPHYGKYGMLRKTYLKEHRPAMYSLYMLEDRLVEHLNLVDDEAQERMDILVRQMMEKQAITEELKACDQMEWVRAVNNIRNAAEEIVLIRYYNVLFYLFFKTGMDDFKRQCLIKKIDDGESMRMKQIQDWCHCHQIPFKTQFTYRKDFSFRVNLWNLYSYCRFKIERQ